MGMYLPSVGDVFVIDGQKLGKAAVPGQSELNT